MLERISVPQLSDFIYVRSVVADSERIVSAGGLEIQFGVRVDKLTVLFR